MVKRGDTNNYESEDSGPEGDSFRERPSARALMNVDNIDDILKCAM